MTFSTLTILLASYSLADKSVQFFYIPSQSINLFKILSDNFKGKEQTINSFQISNLITLKEYKEYLRAIKNDSSEAYYQTQLPDSGIGSVEVRNRYINRSEYNNLPVVGISWDNAMNFCKWKTLNENKDSILFIYRLPHCSEWLAAYSYLSKHKIKNDFNKNYSDWLLNPKDESIFDPQDLWRLSYIYFHKFHDPLTLKRKMVIGNSYLFQQEKLLNYFDYSYYATEGYRQVSFRYIKDQVNQSEIMYPTNKSTCNSILKYWGLNTK